MRWDQSRDEPLDDLLGRAAWPAALPAQVERLERRWQKVVRARRRRIIASVAAGVAVPALCTAMAILISRNRQVEIPGPGQVDAAPAIAERDDGPASEPSVPAPSQQIVRDPNIYEQSIALLYRRQSIPTESVVPQPGPTSDLTTSVASDPQASRRETTAEASAEERPPVDELFAAMSGPKVSVRLSAARTLGEMNDPAVSRRLAQMALENVSRREALVALLASSDFVARNFLAYAERDVALAATVRAVAGKNLGAVNYLAHE